MIIVEKNYIFNYIVSDKIQELIELYLEKGYKKRRIHDVLVDSCIIFESLYYNKDSESNHEDLLDAGYVLGRVQAQEGGCIVVVQLDSFRYFYVGCEEEIFQYIKEKMKR